MGIIKLGFLRAMHCRRVINYPSISRRYDNVEFWMDATEIIRCIGPSMLQRKPDFVQIVNKLI